MSSSNNKKLRIAHIITRMIVGGAQENTLLTIIGHLNKGHEVVLITGPTKGTEGNLLQNTALPKFEIIEVPALVREVNPLKDFMAYQQIKKICRNRRFDVVHTHTSKAGVIGRAAAWDAGIKAVVHTVHGQAFHPYQSKFKNWLYRAAETFAAKRCHRIYAVAQAMIEQCVESGIAPREKYQVVYSGMDIANFLNARPEPELRSALNIPPDVKVVGAIARLFEQKGYEFFIPAARKILDVHPETHFLIVGDGPMRAELDSKILEMNMKEHFHFAGLIPPSEVCRYTALMDVLLHLSLHEGLPRCVVQALACGKPAVGFALDGTPEVIIPGKTGFLASPGSDDEAALGVNKILGDPALASEMGTQGRKNVAEQFAWQKMCDILETEFLRLTGS
ncbi:MAG: glycosyltransferase family 4 protein [Victivallaceae bacterium]|nr:glycosyltransferase family 4 protein [Victivallaceae bacterium]